MDPEETLRSEDDSLCPRAGRTHAILAESPPPPSVPGHTASHYPAQLGENGILPFSVRSAQESPHAGSVDEENLNTDHSHSSPEIMTDLELQGTGPECRSLVRGVMDPEETLRSEDDSLCTRAERTRTILAESSPPPPATRHTGSKSLAPWDKGLFPVSVKSAQESPHAGDQLGMGDLADEEALCRMDDSLPRTHPCLLYTSDAADE